MKNIYLIAFVFNIFKLAIVKANLCISTTIDCDATCLGLGNKSDIGNCREPTEGECLTVASSECSALKTRCIAQGFVKNSSDDDCFKPTNEDCFANTVSANLC